MIRSLYYTFDKNHDGIDYVDYEYKVTESIEDIKKYEYELAYNKKYNYLSWYLEEGAKELIKSIEDKWLTNSIDVSSYYSFDFRFKDWLHDYYYKTALQECLDEYEDAQDYSYMVTEFNE